MSTKTKLHTIALVAFFAAMMLFASAGRPWIAAANCVAFVFSLVGAINSLDHEWFGDRCDCGRDCDHAL